MKEIWKDVVGYEGLYQVSSMGNVRSIDRKTNTALKHQNYVIKRGKNLIPHITRGYYVVSLSNGKSQVGRIHKLVARTFLPNPENKPCVNHIDGNKLNNCVDNLEWCTYKENTQHAHKIGLVSREQELTRAKEMREARIRPVMQLKNGVEIAKYESIKQAEELTGIKADNIWHCLNEYCKRASGYEWKYL